MEGETLVAIVGSASAVVITIIGSAFALGRSLGRHSQKIDDLCRRTDRLEKRLNGFLNTQKQN